MTITRLSIAVAASLVLAACGGGGSEPPVQPLNGVPASALVSATAYSTWVGARPADNGTEPLSVTDVVAPTSDTDEPLPLR